MQTFKKTFSLLNNHERIRLMAILFMMFVMALLDTLGVASILPFMAVLTNPSIIETNIIIKTLFETSAMFGVQNNQQFLFALGVTVFILLIISLTFKALTIYLQTLFIHMCEHEIGKRLVENYLNQPYSWFLSQNSANLGKTVLSETQQVINYGINSLMEIFSKGMVALSLLTLLLITNLKIAIIVGTTVVGAYGLIFYFTRLYVDQIGRERLKNNQIRFISVRQAFDAIKEIKVRNLEKIYSKIFADSSLIFARTQAHSKIISQIPRFFLEILAFGGILIITLSVIFQTGKLNESIPLISLYVFAGYRLMPAVQQIYASITNLNFSTPSLDKIYDDLKNLKIENTEQDKEKIILKKNIVLNKVSFTYPNASKTALKNININIPVNTTVGFVGTTGSGKTTLVDIILGLNKPQNGSLEIDNKIIYQKNMKNWQKLIGYVPQHINLTDDTISANIAFGVKKSLINLVAVEEAAKLAKIDHFILNELQEKYQTIIGENGIRLSGGQRQRIGIARALYHKPKVLILDEATSALDNHTESAVMESIDNLRKDITIILIAHRLSTLNNCNKIFIIEKGQIIKDGKFEDLININENLKISANLK